MPIERTEEVSPLTPRVKRFLVEALGGVDQDQIRSHEEMRVDYVCLRGLLAIEIKSLDEDGSARIDNLTSELSKREDWPEFIGPAPIDAYLKHTNDPHGLRRRYIERIGRAIVNHLKKANKQLRAHKLRFPRQNIMGVVLLVNEDHATYDPRIVTHILQLALRRRDSSVPLYEHVDSVVYLTERHQVERIDRRSNAIIFVEGTNVECTPWKSSVSAHFSKKWAEWNDVPLEQGLENSLPEFSTIDRIPREAPRHEQWRREYRRDPYLRGLSQEELRDRYDDIYLLGQLAFLIGSPIKVPDFVIAVNMARFTHMMEEMAERAIPADTFRFEFERNIAAAQRLGVPQVGIDWLTHLNATQSKSHSDG